MKNKWPGVVQCLVCEDVLVSNTRHAFVTCSCRNGCYVDGGKDYIRCGAKDLSKTRVLKLSVAKRRNAK